MTRRVFGGGWHRRAASGRPTAAHAVLPRRRGFTLAGPEGKLWSFGTYAGSDD